MISIARRIALLVAVLAIGGPALAQQGAETALKDRVAQLIERLESPKIETCAAAEKSLIDLGPRVLPYLPAEVNKATKADLADRVERVRAALREKEEKTNLGASKVTLKGKAMRLSEAIKSIQTQSGNQITDIRESYGTEVTNPAVDLDIEDKPFFEALDILAEKADIMFSPNTGDGSLGIMAGAGMKAQPGGPAMPRPMVVYNGPFRVEFKQLAFVKTFASPTPGIATATFEVMWEPRLRPMLLAIKNEDLVIVDDQNKPVAPQVSEESNETGLKAGNCVAEVNLNLIAPDRSAKTISSLKVKGAVTVPAGMRTFKFPNLAKPNVVEKQGDVSVTLQSTEVDEQIWKIALMIAYPGEGPAFESYRQGLFNNRIWLQKSDGSRFEHNGGYSNTGSDEGRMGFEYMFVDVPGKPSDHMLVYESPAKVVPIPLEFEFKDVTLP